jgi:hypothetical protein
LAVGYPVEISLNFGREVIIDDARKVFDQKIGCNFSDRSGYQLATISTVGSRGFGLSDGAFFKD